MKMKNLILIIVMLVFNHSCRDKKDCHIIITFKNTTTDTLYVVSSYQYPDTSSFAGIPSPVLNPNFTRVLPNESNTQVLWSRDCIELAFKSLIPSDTMMIYVFDAQTLDSVSWNDVIRDYKVLQRYDLSLQDIKDLRWNITYPPMPEMSTIKMYPPHKK